MRTLRRLALAPLFALCAIFAFTANPVLAGIGPCNGCGDTQNAPSVWDGGTGGFVTAINF